MDLQTYQLRDIHGLDAVPWWPPAPGWWLLGIGLILGLWLLWRLAPHLRIPGVVGLTWRWDAARRLRELRRRVRSQDTKQSAGELSELLRRIAMARRGRDACAGLSGRSWLEWLQAHDPRGFDWSTRGSLLLDLPYAPPGSSEADSRALLELIDAAQNWVARERTERGGKHDV
jgi:hypothetical protein